MSPFRFQKPFWLNVCCIFSLAIGMLLVSFLIFPQTHSDVYERIMTRNLTSVVITIGVLCIFLPAVLLKIMLTED